MQKTLFMRLRHFFKDTRAGVLVEMGMLTPVLLIILIGGFEIGRYIYTNQKIQRTAMTLADIAARGQTLSATDLSNLFAAADEVAKPFNITSSGRVIITSVIDGGGGTPEIDWQRTSGAIAATSAVGSEGGGASISDNFLIENNQSIIVAEVFYNYVPMFTSFMDPSTLYHQAVFRPRLSRIVELE